MCTKPFSWTKNKGKLCLVAKSSGPLLAGLPLKVGKSFYSFIYLFIYLCNVYFLFIYFFICFFVLFACSYFFKTIKEAKKQQ